jgi:hypothetical protein
MMNSDVATAKRELLKTIDQWECQMQRIKTLIRESDTYDPGPFGLSMAELMPEAVRRMKGVFAWSQIMVQLKGDHTETGRTSTAGPNVDREG